MASEDQGKQTRFDPRRRAAKLAALRRRQVLDELSLSATERLAQADELLSLSWALSGRPSDIAPRKRRTATSA